MHHNLNFIIGVTSPFFYVGYSESIPSDQLLFAIDLGLGDGAQILTLDIRLQSGAAKGPAISLLAVSRIHLHQQLTTSRLIMCRVRHRVWYL